MSDNPDLFWQVNIGDYLRDTQHLNAEEHGAYLLLLMHYWIRGPLPDDDDRLALISRCSSNAWSNAQASVLAFFEHRNGHYHHKRVDRDRASAIERMQKARDKAKAAAEARWGKVSGENLAAQPRQNHASSNATSIPQALHEDMLEECQTETETEVIKRESNAREKSTAEPTLVATLIDPCFTPDETPSVTKAKEQWPPGLFDEELQTFIDHAKANARTQSDWQAAFRTWIKKTNDRMRNNYGTGIPASRANRTGERKSGFARALDDTIAGAGDNQRLLGQA